MTLRLMGAYVCVCNRVQLLHYKVYIRLIQKNDRWKPDYKLTYYFIYHTQYIIVTLAIDAYFCFVIKNRTLHIPMCACIIQIKLFRLSKMKEQYVRQWLLCWRRMLHFSPTIQHFRLTNSGPKRSDRFFC